MPISTESKLLIVSSQDKRGWLRKKNILNLLISDFCKPIYKYFLNFVFKNKPSYRSSLPSVTHSFLWKDSCSCDHCVESSFSTSFNTSRKNGIISLIKLNISWDSNWINLYNYHKKFYIILGSHSSWNETFFSKFILICGVRLLRLMNYLKTKFPFLNI